MLGETHDIVHEFPNYLNQISKLKDRNPVFAALMKEHDSLDTQIRGLEEHDQPVSDFYMEDLKKKRALLKDRIYELLRKTA